MFSKGFSNETSWIKMIVSVPWTWPASCFVPNLWLVCPLWFLFFFFFAKAFSNPLYEQCGVISITIREGTQLIYGRPLKNGYSDSTNICFPWSKQETIGQEYLLCSAESHLENFQGEAIVWRACFRFSNPCKEPDQKRGQGRSQERVIIYFRGWEEK